MSFFKVSPAGDRMLKPTQPTVVGLLGHGVSSLDGACPLTPLGKKSPAAPWLICPLPWWHRPVLLQLQLSCQELLGLLLL